jgi:flagellar basal body rod protein FlgF
MGTYTFNLVQNEKNKMLITSYFVTKSDKIPVSNVAAVEQMYNAVKSRKEFSIKFKVIR